MRLKISLGNLNIAQILKVDVEKGSKNPAATNGNELPPNTEYELQNRAIKWLKKKDDPSETPSGGGANVTDLEGFDPLSC